MFFLLLRGQFGLYVTLIVCYSIIQISKMELHLTKQIAGDLSVFLLFDLITGKCNPTNNDWIIFQF